MRLGGSIGLTGSPGSAIGRPASRASPPPAPAYRGGAARSSTVADRARSRRRGRDRGRGSARTSGGRRRGRARRRGARSGGSGGARRSASGSVACTDTSSDAVGSSRTRRRGSEIRARAIADPRLLAAGELMRPARRDAPAARPTSSAIASTRGAVSASTSRVRPRPMAMLRTVREGRVERVVGVLEDELDRRAVPDRGRSALAGCRVMSRPSKRIVPSLGSISRATSCASVDLPEPLSPTTPRLSPSASVRSTPSTAWS